MSWPQSLIKLAGYEVEVRQKRLAEVLEERTRAELLLAGLEEEGRVELASRNDDPLAGLFRAAFLDALRTRKDRARARIAALTLEEQGARDALAEAFEAQKKYEHVAEQARLAEVRTERRRETAALDELGLRKASR